MQTTVGIDALVCSCSPPFTVGVVTDAALDNAPITTAGGNRGDKYFSIYYLAELQYYTI